MDNLEQPKLSYIPNQFRVRCEFTKEYCDAHPQPPEHLLERAIRKLALEMALGQVAEYSFFESKLNQVWQVFRESSEPQDSKIAITLASGAPNFNGLRIEKSDDQESLVSISIDLDSETFEKAVSRDLFKYRVGKIIRSYYTNYIYDLSDIYGIWFTAVRGDKVQSLKVKSLKKQKEYSKKFQFIHNKTFNILSLHVYDVRPAEDEDFFAKLVKFCHKEALKVFGPKNYIILKNDLVRRFRSANRGIERLGFDLPLVIPAAIPAKAGRKPVKSIHKSDTEVAFDNEAHFLKTFDSFVSIKVSPDHMRAVIDEVDSKIYFDFPSLKPQWLINELQRRRFRMDEEALTLLRQAIENRRPIRYFNLSLGQEPQHAAEPFLHLSYQDREIPQDHENIDFRHIKPKDLVYKGDLVAEIRFKTPPIAGYNVYGEVLDPQINEDLTIPFPKEIERRDLQFYALFDGVPVVSEKAITFKRMLHHKGDVNLTTGDIRFTGPVIIDGNVEQGASLHVSGDVHIKGGFYGHYLHVTGDLKVQGGIKPSSKLFHFVGGDLNTKFMEGANIRVQGSSTIAKNLMGGHFVAGDHLQVLGSITACQVYAQGDIVTKDVGRKQGSHTDIYLGISFKVARSYTLNIHRVDFFTELSQEINEELKALQAQSKDTTALEHRLNRVLAIIKKLNGVVRRRHKKLIDNRESRLSVKGILCENTRLFFSDKPCLVNHDIAAVDVRYIDNARGIQDYVVPIRHIS